MTMYDADNDILELNRTYFKIVYIRTS